MAKLWQLPMTARHWNCTVWCESLFQNKSLTKPVDTYGAVEHFSQHFSGSVFHAVTPQISYIFVLLCFKGNPLWMSIIWMKPTLFCQKDKYWCYLHLDLLNPFVFECFRKSPCLALHFLSLVKHIPCELICLRLFEIFCRDE